MTFNKTEQINNDNNWYDISDKLYLLKSYIHILKNSDSYIENIDLVDNSQLKNDSTNIDIAINYFTIIYNFLIIERMFSLEVKQSNKELNKNLQLTKLNNVDDVLELFLKLYNNESKIKFAIETFDDIEDISIFIENNETVYKILM